jgi:hypothetical protein
MTVSMFIRRAMAIGVAVIAISGVVGGQAMASPSHASTTGHVLEMQATRAGDLGTVTPNASGGGCATNGLGFIAACISASTSYERPDAYINSVPNSRCYSIWFILTDYTTGDLLEDFQLPCYTTGHFGPYPYPGIPGHRYVTTVDFYGSNIFSESVSPISYF